MHSHAWAHPPLTYPHPPEKFQPLPLQPQLPPLIPPPAPTPLPPLPPPHQVDFHTSAERGAGTDANVYMQLVGERGESDVQRVVAPREAFERGTTDSFTFKWVGRHAGGPLVGL